MLVNTNSHVNVYLLLLVNFKLALKVHKKKKKIKTLNQIPQIFEIGQNRRSIIESSKFK